MDLGRFNLRSILMINREDKVQFEARAIIKNQGREHVIANWYRQMRRGPQVPPRQYGCQMMHLLQISGARPIWDNKNLLLYAQEFLRVIPSDYQTFSRKYMRHSQVKSAPFNNKL